MSNQPPTDDELAAIRARADAATRGLWIMRYDDEYKRNLYTVGDRREDDAEFIAHARTDIPALLAEVERLRTLLATLPMDEMNIALEISGETQYGHRVVNLLTWHNDNEVTVDLIARQWHDAHAVKAPVE